MNYSAWVPLLTEQLGASAKRKISLLTSAIRDYIDGKGFDRSLEKEGIYRQTLLRAFNRCLALDATGNVYGWRALSPGLHVRPNERHKPLTQSGRGKRGGLSGALQLFLRSNVEIADAFESYLLATARRCKGHEAGLRQKSAHQKFIQLCAERGVLQSQWPLSTKRKGRESVRLYVDRFLELRYDDIVGTQYGQRAKARSHTCTGNTGRLTAFRPFDIVEIDEHKCGFLGSIGIPTPDGMRWVPIERITIIVVADRTLTYILGYKIIFRREANADDLLDALNSAVSQEAPRSDTIGCEVTSSLGLPDFYFSSGGGLAFNQVLFDNALIHLATEVEGRVREIIGCDFNYGPVRRFDRRPTIENIFGGLERLGFRRLPNTVGSSPVDPKRQDAEGEAVKARLTLKQIVDLVESVILDHNQRVSKSNFGSTPGARVDAARCDLDGTGVILPALPIRADGVAGLDVSIVALTIRGSPETGRRPYFTFEGESYTGTRLAHDWSLVGTTVLAYVKRHAIREIQIFQKSGAFIDTAKVMGRWRHTEHSRVLRKHINALIQDGYLSVGYLEDPVNRYLESILASVRGGVPSNGKPTKKTLSVFSEHQLEQQSTGEVFTAASEDRALGSEGDEPKSTTDRGSVTTTEAEDEFLEFNELDAFGATTK